MLVHIKEMLRSKVTYDDYMCGQISEHPQVFPYECNLCVIRTCCTDPWKNPVKIRKYVYQFLYPKINPYMYGFLWKIKNPYIQIFATKNPGIGTFTSKNLYGNVKIFTHLGTFHCSHTPPPHLKFLEENGINCTRFVLNVLPILQFVFHFFPRYEQKFVGGGQWMESPFSNFFLKMMSMNCSWFLLHCASFKQQKWPDLTKYNCITKSELENYEIFMEWYSVTNRYYAVIFCTL